MAPKYKIGSKIAVKPVREGVSSAWDSDIAQYAGQIGTVTNYHWISPTRSTVFYIYTVKMESSQKEIVLHEDELETATARSRNDFD